MPRPETYLDNLSGDALRDAVSDGISYLGYLNKINDIESLSSSVEGVDIPELMKMLKVHEGSVQPEKATAAQLNAPSLAALHVRYKDSKGIPTIGYGFNLQDSANKKFLQSLGVNADALLFITDAHAQKLLEYTTKRAIEDTKRSLPKYSSLSDTQKRVAIDLMFNSGYTVFNKFSGFKRALQAGDMKTAAENLRWQDVGNKAKGETPYWINGKSRPKALYKMLLNDPDVQDTQPAPTKLDPGVYQDEAGNIFTVDQNGITSR